MTRLFFMGVVMSKKQPLKGKVTVKKKSLKDRFFKNLINEDAGSIGDYIIDELIFPTLMAGINSVITGASNKIFGGGTIRGGNSGTKSNATYVDYRAVSNSPRVVTSANRYDVKRFLFSERKDAEDIKDQLCALIESNYQAASVGDLYDFLGEDTQSTDWNYGWKSTKGISVKYTSEGYILDMPNPIPIR